MKKWYKIGLFFICIIIVCLMLVILWKRHSYPDYSIEESQEGQVLEPQKNQQKDKLSQANQVNVITTCDTICQYEEINQKDGTIHIEEIQLPEKYIGMTRQQLEQALEQDIELSPIDKKKRLVSQYLESFSSEKVKIVRIYELTEETGYYIMAQNHYVCVYKADKQTLYFQSEILLEDLPLVVQEEVNIGKYMSSEMEVFHFLESYSS